LGTAFSDTPESDVATRGRIVANLAITLMRWDEAQADEGRLRRAVVLARTAVAAASPRGADRPVRLRNLAVALSMLATRVGDGTLLDEAIAVARTAVESASGGADGAAVLGPLLQARYMRENTGTDLEAAVDATRAAADATRVDHPERAARLSNLGNALRFRGVWSRRLADLDEAVEVLREAVKCGRRAGADAAGRLSNLGAALQSRAEVTRDPTGLDEAVDVLRKAAELGSPTTSHPLYLSNLANAIVLRSELGDGSTAADEAVGLQREALATLPDRHPYRARVLANLANALSAAYLAGGGPDALQGAMEAAGEVSADHAANTQDRMVAAWRLGDLSVRASNGDAAAAFPAMRLAIELAERAAWIGLPPPDRDHALARFTSLASDAGASAVAAGDASAALAMLEAGRSVRWRDRLQARQFDDLRDEFPALASRLRAAGGELGWPDTVG
jgi:hypothetical protein